MTLRLLTGLHTQRKAALALALLLSAVSIPLTADTASAGHLRRG